MAPVTMPKVALDHELSSRAFDKEITKCTTKKQHIQKQGKQIRKPNKRGLWTMLFNWNYLCTIVLCI